MLVIFFGKVSRLRQLKLDILFNIISRLLFMAPKPPLKNLEEEWSTPLDNSFNIKEVKGGPI